MNEAKQAVNCSPTDHKQNERLNLCTINSLQFYSASASLKVVLDICQVLVGLRLSNSRRNCVTAYDKRFSVLLMMESQMK